ncbi:hypothetical protein XOC_1202 [Xanthomonas oryzae pv. oryzicola BLS256]|uniref:Uncharacterized protein n=1 Tax=Xanthomonas oryzae pv. oryzicola (strain BLS256) TaxID=383407 RepID=G7TGJ6_XANOB|nr:hypothetical protein XOC_1202 [Xanthomonas oryzae pv. oryzicola BLS256]QEO98730.1 hypothetical protein XOCgx_3741 [Xanthomonas oryzae pv. oryzicola]
MERCIAIDDRHRIGIGVAIEDRIALKYLDAMMKQTDRVP